jgi:hypothetical protein
MLEPVLGTNSNTLAQLIFQHWKTALEHGYTPKSDLLCFYRGLFSVARIAYQLAPSGDPLREGMEEVRADRILAEMKDIADWRYWFQNSDKFATALVALPKIVDDALTRASGPNQSASTLGDSAPERKTGAFAANVTLVLALVAVLFVFHGSSTNLLQEKAALLLLLLVGLMVLKQLAD